MKEAMEEWKRYQNILTTLSAPANYAAEANARQTLKSDYAYITGPVDNFTKFLTLYNRRG